MKHTWLRLDVHLRWQLVSKICEVMHHCLGTIFDYTITNPMGVSESEHWCFTINSIATSIGIIIYLVINH